MKDVELVKACAEACGIADLAPVLREGRLLYYAGDYEGMILYDPLHDDAQAMGLVKKLRLEPRYNVSRDAWLVTPSYGHTPSAWGADLNRAIVECVAKLQEAK